VSRVPEAPIWTGARTNVPTDGRVLVPFGGPSTQASITGHYHVLSYDPLPIDAFDKLQQSADPNDPTTPINRLLGVNYYASIEPYDNPDFELIGIAYDSYYYARRDPFPRAWIAQHIVIEPNDQAVRAHLLDPATDTRTTVYVDRAVTCPGGDGTATITDYGTNEVTISTEGDGGLLVLSDQYYPGWRATIDGDDAAITRADTVLRAVCVPPGSHTVRFTYRPLSFMVGAAVTIIGWVLWVVVGVFAWRRMRVAGESPGNESPGYASEARSTGLEVRGRC
jgi:hypothetical protein